MKARRRALLLPLILLAVLTTAVAAWRFVNADAPIRDVTVTLKGVSEPATIPYLADTDRKVPLFALEMTVGHTEYTSGRFRITPDDCLRSMHVNDRPVDLGAIRGGHLCDWGHGFEIDLNPYLKPGDNHFRFQLRDRHGKRGLNVRTVIPEPLTYLLKGSLGFLIFLFSMLLMRRMQFSITLSVLFSLGILLRIFYLIETPWDQRTFDVNGHVDYIKYIASHGLLPEADACWTCYHPPLYYLLGALFYLAGLPLGEPAALKSLQVLSFLLSAGFLLFVLLILKEHIKQRGALIAASALIIFLPGMVIHSARIGNDVLLYFTYAAAFYFYLRWLRLGRGLVLSTLFAVASLFVKSNGIIILGVLGLSFLIRTIALGSWRAQLRTIFLVALVYAIAVGATVGLHKARGGEGIISNSNSLHHALFVDNAAFNYLYFDTKIAFEKPFVDAWHDDSGREYFWNYYMQSALYAQLPFPDRLKSMGSVMSFLFFHLVLMGLAGVLFMKRHDAVTYAPYLLNAILTIAAAVYLRAMIPAACSNDFRYSIPLLISLALFFAAFIMMVRKYEWIILEWLGYLMVLMLSALSAVFIVSL